MSRLHEFCTCQLGSGFAPLERWKERHRRNPNIFYMVKEISEGGFSRSEKIVGSFSITPLTEAAKALLEAEQITGLDFTSEHITAPDTKPAALYITGIVAEGFYARGKTLSLLVRELKDQKNKGNVLFYTKPITREGLRIVRAYGFAPVNPDPIEEINRVYRLEVN